MDQKQNQKVEIIPQSTQLKFLSSEAEIAIFGGSAGGGKTFSLLLDPLRHYKNKDFEGVIFRRTAVQIRNPGGLWQESMKLYPLFNAVPRESFLSWKFPSGFKMKFSHLEYDKDLFGWQGSQLAWVGWDELTHFSEQSFFYILSRLRTMSGISPRIRATTNPDPDSFVRQLINWYLSPEGYPIPERSGVIRWFIRQNDSLIWADSKETLINEYGNEVLPKSFTFIASTIYDNKILLEKNPEYLSNLKALSRVDRMRLLEGNWSVRESAGMLFRREWFSITDNLPGGWIQCVRFWDRASTKPSESNKDPDWTRGLKMYKYPNDTYIVADLKSIRDTPGQVQQLIRNVASHDTHHVRIMSQQDPGSAGVMEAEYFIKMLSGFDVHVETMSKDKITRAKPVSAQSEAGNIRVLRAPWNEEFFIELENFPEGNHDDIVDVLSGCYNAMSQGISSIDAFWMASHNR